jgi:hypothetical protein
MKRKTGQSNIHCDLQAVRDILQEQELSEDITDQ